MSDPCSLFIDQTHLRGHVTGLERVALDLFTAEHLAPHPVRFVRSRGLLSMIVNQQLTLPLRALAERGSIAIFPGFPPGPLAALLRERCVMYVHDTFPVSRTEDLNWKGRLYLTPTYARAMRFVRHFFVNTESTGKSLRRICLPDARIALLRPPVRDCFGLSRSSGPARWLPGTPLRLLALGTVEPRKDYPAALAFVAALIRQGIEAELHIVGRVGWGQHDFLANPPPYLTLHGYLPDEAVSGLAETCHALLSTAKAEGLGLPLLEVQHGGMPVIAPQGDVFAEVLGDSGLFIRPTDPDASATLAARWLRDAEAASRTARANVARWNALAEADASRFKVYLRGGMAAHRWDGLIP